MMNKQKVFTAMGVMISFVIAVGGWALTSTLIDKRSDALLSASGITWINAPDARLSESPVSPTAVGDPSGEAPMFPDNNQNADVLTLSENEIISIIRNLESPAIERLHEPTADQMTMEQAIAAGQAWCSVFSENGIVPDELLKWEDMRINAYLSQRLPRDQSEQFLNPIYSYWTVTYSSVYMDANLDINAVTGKVLMADIALHSYPHTDLYPNAIENILVRFIADLGLDSFDGIKVTNDIIDLSAYTLIAGGNAYGVVNTIGRVTTEGTYVISNIHVYLSMQEPQLYRSYSIEGIDEFD